MSSYLKILTKMLQCNDFSKTTGYFISINAENQYIREFMCFFLIGTDEIYWMLVLLVYSSRFLSYIHIKDNLRFGNFSCFPN
jgi:hypothetical protein